MTTGHFQGLLCVLLLAVTPVVADWDEEANGPLPRWREGGTPEVLNQTLSPYTIQLGQYEDAPGMCAIDSPPEYSPTDGVLMRYSTGAWPGVVTDLVAALTGDPTKDEIAYVVVSNTAVQNTATNQFTAAGADMSKVEFIIKPNDSIWLRDYGPHFIWQAGALGVADSHYYPTRPLDNYIPTLVADDFYRVPSYDIPLYYSGGNFQPGPNRSGYITSLINLDNPGFGEAFVAELYGEYQGIDSLTVFPKLPSSVDGTGHIDMWFYMVDEDTVIISEFIPGSNATAIEITNNAADFMEAEGWEVFRPPALNIGSVHYTYANAFRVNDRIFIPTYGEGNAIHLARDTEALATWQAAAGPGVEIVGINSYDIIPAAGAIHCIVMQVPRHTASDPSACVTSPVGDELLLAGKSHAITWAATDDVDVDAIDVYYTTDDVNYEPIALDQPGFRDRFIWDVPLLESGAARIKVVASDDDANTGEAIGETSFPIGTALQRVYDFSSGAGIDKWAWGYQTLSWSVVDAARKPSVINAELSATDYAKIAASDASGSDADTNRYKSPIPSSVQESTHIFEFTIDEDPSEIVDVEILWEGYGDQCLQMELYVWDYQFGRWCDGRGQCGENRFIDNWAGNEDDKLSGHILQNFDRYIDPAGQMTLLVYAERFGQESFHDYVSVTVSHEPCLGIDNDFDGWGDACDNCPLTATTDQANEDLDDRGDACDCAPSDGSAFTLPNEIGGVRFSDAATIAWDSDAGGSGSGITYGVLTGSQDDLPVGGSGEQCLDPGLSAETLTGLSDPVEESVDYYLVRGQNACGAGGYGSDSVGADRTTGVCDTP